MKVNKAQLQITRSNVSGWTRVSVRRFFNMPEFRDMDFSFGKGRTSFAIIIILGAMLKRFNDFGGSFAGMLARTVSID